MKNKILIIFSIGIIILVFVLYKNIQTTTFDSKVLQNIEQFELAKNILLKNKKSIKISINNPSSNSNGYIFTSNKYYFQNSIVSPNQDIKSLKKIVNLWDDKLVEDKSWIMGIWFQEDNTIGFTIKNYESLLPLGPTISHLLVYDPANKSIAEYNKGQNKIIQIKRIKKDWIYIIKKTYFND